MGVPELALDAGQVDQQQVPVDCHRRQVSPGVVGMGAGGDS